MDRLWSVRAPAPSGHLARFAHLPRPVAQVLYNRGISDPAEAEVFFACRFDQDNPFTMRGMYEAVKRLRAAIRAGEPIVVHGDFDADGVTSTVVMVSGLEALGARVRPYIPHRVDEGYGLNAAAIRRLAEEGMRLMITVDCGIRAHEEIALANELGVDVIVTDHHSPGATLPDALAIINPHQPGCDYPYKYLAGVGLAWKTVQALWMAEQKSPLGNRRAPVSLNELLELVAVGTVADIAPLTGENRALVARGLMQLRQSQRPGLLALMESAGVKQPSLTAESIGFGLGPRINAAGRMAHAKLAYQLLQAPTAQEAWAIAGQLEAQNERRQQLTRQAMERAFAQLPATDGPLLLVCDSQCPEGIVGLVAGRLAESFYRPTIVVAQGPEESRASCRSIPEFHITRALEQVAPLLERYGGHAAAAGFTVRSERLPELSAALQQVAQQVLPPERLATLRPKLVADAELPLHEVDDALAEALAQLGPFGAENEEPLWMCRGVRVQAAQGVGKHNSHLKLTLVDQGGRPWKAIAFRQGHRLADLPDQLDLAYAVKRDEWQGRRRLELLLTDFRPARQG